MKELIARICNEVAEEFGPELYPSIEQKIVEAYDKCLCGNGLATFWFGGLHWSCRYYFDNESFRVGCYDPDYPEVLNLIQDNCGEIEKEMFKRKMK